MRRLLIMLALTAMAVLAVACDPSENGGSPAKNPSDDGAPGGAERPTPVETVQVAYGETAAGRTARISYEAATMGLSANPENSAGASSRVVTAKGGGVTDFSGAFRMTIGMPGMGGFQMRQIGETVYVKVPDEFASRVSGSKPWIRVDLDALYGQRYGGAPVQGGASQDPTRQLEYLRGVSDSVEKIGEERVRGVPTTRYEAVIDLNKEVAGQDAGIKEANRELVKRLGTSKLPVEVGIDEENRFRRYALDVGRANAGKRRHTRRFPGGRRTAHADGDRVLRFRCARRRLGAALGSDHGRLEAAVQTAAGRAVAASSRFY